MSVGAVYFGHSAIGIPPIKTFWIGWQISTLTLLSAPSDIYNQFGHQTRTFFLISAELKEPK